MDAETIREFARRIAFAMEIGETPRRYEVLQVAKWVLGTATDAEAVANAATNHGLHVTEV